MKPAFTHYENFNQAKWDLLSYFGFDHTRHQFPLIVDRRDHHWYIADGAHSRAGSMDTLNYALYKNGERIVWCRSKLIPAYDDQAIFTGQDFTLVSNVPYQGTIELLTIFTNNLRDDS